MEQATTIEMRMRSGLGDLTRAERQVATHILSHFPMSALGSITTLARAADVSSPTIVRLVQKLGYRGWTEYQTALRQEVQQLLVAPLGAVNGVGGAEAAAGEAAHPLQGFAAQVVANIGATVSLIPAADFNGAAALMADLSRRVVVMGGRLTHALADYMGTLLRVTRPDVTLVADHLTDWQQVLLDLAPGDVVVIFDIRRYEANAVQFAEFAALQGAEVVLITDRWLSPAASHARHVLPCHIEMPAAWDSTAVLLMVVEALLARVQSQLPDQVQDRLNRLEDCFARTRVFRAPKMGQGR
ncbi:MurR/RpiR family transcriptional regulator [Xinfangfangia sp. D13-10-4-6]|uniref:MurR/RpiR family transcriptional regulator n=1 Tax=Pseudogemmobacter hezensis TaxID=2737662 RepID=UPI0015534B67|nr:MurR/RpiR family transcriptional regulator [Pseudogemmobacter hezensis]NPD16440.1 MurR/RpiR family transcriptional regulator [Pseudogemmobacter hezensis]